MEEPVQPAGITPSNYLTGPGWVGVCRSMFLRLCVYGNVCVDVDDLCVMDTTLSRKAKSSSNTNTCDSTLGSAPDGANDFECVCVYVCVWVFN